MTNGLGSHWGNYWNGVGDSSCGSATITAQLLSFFSSFFLLDTFDFHPGRLCFVLPHLQGRHYRHLKYVSSRKKSRSSRSSGSLFKPALFLPSIFITLPTTPIHVLNESPLRLWIFYICHLKQPCKQSHLTLLISITGVVSSTLA